MKINKLNQRPGISEKVKLNRAYTQLEKLITELNLKELPDEIVSNINNDISGLNSIPDSGKRLRNQIRKRQSKIVRLVEKELKIVPKNYYRNTWLAIGMAGFGIPFGVAFGTSLGNMAFLGIGIPFGLVIGIAIGSGMDKKAYTEGRQLDLEIKY